MTISGISTTNLWSHYSVQKSVSNFQQGKASSVNTLQKTAANLQSKVIAQSGAAVNPSRQLNRDYILDRYSAFGVINAAEESLSHTEGVLAEIKKLAELASDPSTSQQDRDNLQKRMEELLNRLNEISDSSGLLDGSFGGVGGKEGVASMGVDSIRSDGTLSGRFKFHITNKDGRFSITARINGETVTNTLSRDDKETTFTFSGGKTITLRFDKGAYNLQAGVMTNINFSLGSKTAELKDAVSNDKSLKTIIIEGFLPLPQFFDTSAIGLGLEGLNISGLGGAKAAADMARSAINKVANLRNDLAYTKAIMLANYPFMRQIGSASQPVDAGAMETIMASAQREMEKQAAEAIQAQTSRLSRQNMLSLLIA